MDLIIQSGRQPMKQLALGASKKLGKQVREWCLEFFLHRYTTFLFREDFSDEITRRQRCERRWEVGCQTSPGRSFPDGGSRRDGGRRPSVCLTNRREETGKNPICKSPKESHLLIPSAKGSLTDNLGIKGEEINCSPLVGGTVAGQRAPQRSSERQRKTGLP